MDIYDQTDLISSWQPKPTAAVGKYALAFHCRGKDDVSTCNVALRN